MAVKGYLRVSTIDQSTEKFRAEIRKYVNDKELGNVKFIEEKVSGTKNWKERKLGELINKMSEGDVLIVPELSRLARSVLQVNEIVTELKKKKIEIHMIKENLVLNRVSGDDMNSEMAFHMFTIMGQFERKLISMRTKESLQALKKKGVKLGRKKGSGIKLEGQEQEILKYIELGVTVCNIAKILGVHRNTMQSFIKEKGLKNDKRKKATSKG